MKTQKEINFDQNYSALTLKSAVNFTLCFIGFIFILNLTYLPKVIDKNGISGIFILFAYYFITSIVLAPVLILMNSLLIFLGKKIIKLIYIIQPITGFIAFPAIMTIIPFLMTLIIRKFVGSINTFDYYFIYFTTWISSVIQYIWILNSIKQPKEETLTEKQITFLKNTDEVDYF